MIPAIESRRSVRRYKPDAVPKELIEQILRAGVLAPSAKNRQPWRFVVATGGAKADALAAMEKGLAREQTEPFLPENMRNLSGAQHTLDIMKAAPAVIFIVNTLALPLDAPLTAEQRVYDICNVQSIGAAIENMTLTADALGLGSLWICNTFFAHRELCDWLGSDGELCAALAVGYADEQPPARPRKEFDSAVEWR